MTTLIFLFKPSILWFPQKNKFLPYLKINFLTTEINNMELSKPAILSTKFQCQKVIIWKVMQIEFRVKDFHKLGHANKIYILC
jgi:hypothetical protein